jgi:hypothetical protein
MRDARAVSARCARSQCAMRVQSVRDARAVSARCARSQGRWRSGSGPVAFGVEVDGVRGRGRWRSESRSMAFGVEAGGVRSRSRWRPESGPVASGGEVDGVVINVDGVCGRGGRMRGRGRAFSAVTAGCATISGVCWAYTGDPRGYGTRPKSAEMTGRAGGAAHRCAGWPGRPGGVVHVSFSDTSLSSMDITPRCAPCP